MNNDRQNNQNDRPGRIQEALKTHSLLLLLAAVAMAVFFAIEACQENCVQSYAAPGYSAEIIQLAKPSFDSGTSVEKALLVRRSVRDFRDEPVSLAEIGQLLWAAQGVTASRGFRTAPSAGALYPLELYLVAGNVSGLAPGVYRYHPHAHSLKPMLPGDRRAELSNAALHQSAISKAPASLLFTAVFARTTAKYGERGHRYVCMDLGHAAENVYLQAVSLNLGTVIIGAFSDDSIKKVMPMPPDEDPLSIMPVGKIK